MPHSSRPLGSVALAVAAEGRAERRRIEVRVHVPDGLLGARRRGRWRRAPDIGRGCSRLCAWRGRRVFQRQSWKVLLTRRGAARKAAPQRQALRTRLAMRPVRAVAVEESLNDNTRERRFGGPKFMLPVARRAFTRRVLQNYTVISQGRLCEASGEQLRRGVEGARLEKIFARRGESLPLGRFNWAGRRASAEGRGGTDVPGRRRGGGFLLSSTSRLAGDRFGNPISHSGSATRVVQLSGKSAMHSDLFNLDGEVAAVIGGTGALGRRHGRGAGRVRRQGGGHRPQRRARRRAGRSASRRPAGRRCSSRPTLSTALRWRAHADAIAAQLGTVTVLVNAAGGNRPDATLPPGADFCKLPVAAWQNVFDLNLVGGVAAAVAGVRRGDGGSAGGAASSTSRRWRG